MRHDDHPAGQMEPTLKPNGSGNQESGNLHHATVDAHALLRLDFPPARYVVPGIVTEGLSLLAGPPKVGKSWLLMGMALGVATGTTVLGTIPVEGGDVLFLALEDNARRLQKRLRAVLQGAQGPDLGRLTFATTWDRLDEGGLDRIKRWHDGADNPRLILIDVWTKIRPQRARKAGTLYDEDYAAVSEIQQLANERNFAGVMAHHLKKGGEHDPVDQVSGSVGLTGGVDTVLVLKRERGQADASLFATGREIDEVDWALQFDKDTGLWLKIGDGAEYRRSKEQTAIIHALRDDGPMTPTEISRTLGKNLSTIKTMIGRMTKAGDLVNTSGKYSLPN